MAVEYIFFDLGKVILEFDHSVGLNKLAAATGLSTKQIQSIVFDSGLEDEFETGLVSADQFHARFCQDAASEVSKSQLLEACSNIFTLNATIMPLIGQLSAVNFPKGILSNTCSAHWEFVYAKHSFLRDSFCDYILSYESKSMKPDPKIYTDAISVTGLEPEQIFFIDDKQENVDGAIAAGIDAVLYETAAQVIKDLQRRGVRFNL